MRKGTAVPCLAVVATLVAVATAAPQAAAEARTADAPTDHWVATWAATTQLTETNNMPPAPFTRDNLVLADATLRQTIHVTVGGQRARLWLSNKFGGAPLPITAASVALPAGGGAGVSGIQAGTSRQLTFDGHASVVVPAGSQVASDPLDIALAARSNLTVTLYLAQGQASSNITSHPGSRTTSYMVAGNHLRDASLTGATSVEHWYFLAGLDVMATADTAALVVLGDSLTDGRGSTTNANDRWPDRLFDRFQAQAATSRVAVVNQAAGGNRVLNDGLGPSAVSRFDRDVLGQSGVKWLIVFEGVNDIGTAGATAAAQQAVASGLTTAFDRFITRAHAAGIRVYGATITPFGGNGYDDGAGARESTRQTVNNWIRTSRKFDAVIDLDQVARDPASPRRLLPRYDSGDHLHLSPTGYQALADAVPAVQPALAAGR